MRIRRPDRVIAASLLSALGASLALLAQPSAASTLESYDIGASVRYGCAQHGEDSFVEVTLDGVDSNRLDNHELVLQVGLAGPDSTGSDAVFPEGGPSLVTLGSDPIKVRLAGPAHDGDHVFIRQLDQPGVVTVPLQKTCHRIKPTNFGLAEPAVQVQAKSCTSGSQANLQVTVDNPNEVDRKLEKIGIEQLDYTVLLVRQDGLLAGNDPEGALVSFDEPSASVVVLSHVVSKPARYQVRVIALDGGVVSSDSIRLSCASTGRPGPSSSSRPSPSVPVTPTPSSTPPSATPPTSATPTLTPPSTSAATSSSAPVSSIPASSVPATSTPPATSRPPVSSPPGGAPGPTASSSTSRSSAPAPRPSSSAVQPPNAAPSSSPPTSSAAAAPTSSLPSPSPSIIRLVEPRAKYSGLPVFQKDVALVVLVFSAALAALVGATVVNARRR